MSTYPCRTLLVVGLCTLSLFYWFVEALPLAQWGQAARLRASECENAPATRSKLKTCDSLQYMGRARRFPNLLVLFCNALKAVLLEQPLTTADALLGTPPRCVASSLTIWGTPSPVQSSLYETANCCTNTQVAHRLTGTEPGRCSSCQAVARMALLSTQQPYLFGRALT